MKQIIAALLIGSVAFFMWKTSPIECGFMPRCPIYEHLGLHCSGCGTLRAVHLLLRGDLVGAWHMNPLTILLMPPLAFIAIAELFFKQYKWSNRIHPRYLWMLIGLFILFGILRNLPMFSCLAPH